MSAGELDKESNMQILHIAGSDKPVSFCNWNGNTVLEQRLCDGGGGLDLESSATGEQQREITCAKDAQVDVLTRVVVNLINRRNP
jgi:hypothetical protein